MRESSFLQSLNYACKEEEEVESLNNTYESTTVWHHPAEVFINIPEVPL